MTVRWGILGCGDIARKSVAKSIQDDPNGTLVAACRRTRSKLDSFCADYDVPLAFNSADELIASDQVDAIYIATPVHLHHPHTLAVAAAGKHVLVEKPMALSPRECEAMVEACRAADVRLGVAYYRRFYPMARRIEQLLREGVIGTTLAITVATATPFKIAPGEDGYFRALWAEGGGGALMDIGSHRLNLLLHLFGPVADVQARCETLAADYETDDCATTLLRFESGPHATLHCLFGTTAGVDSFRVIGTRGQIIADPLNGSRLELQTDGERTTESRPRDMPVHAAQIVDFTAAINERRDPLVNGEEGLEANRLMQRIYDASRLS